MTATTAELVALDDLDPKARRVLASIDMIEALGEQLTARVCDLQDRMGAAALYARHAIRAAMSALDAYDHPHQVHDNVVEAIAHLRTLGRILEETDVPQKPVVLLSDRIMQHLNKHPEGMTRSQILSVISPARHDNIAAVLRLLQERGEAYGELQRRSRLGRPAEIWRAGKPPQKLIAKE